MTLWLQFARLDLMLDIFKIKLHNFSYLILSFSLSSEYTFLNRHQTSVWEVTLIFGCQILIRRTEQHPCIHPSM